jgi:hypothetical protein
LFDKESEHDNLTTESISTAAESSSISASASSVSYFLSADFFLPSGSLHGRP